jgi:TrmH family RNA methyltransferase
MGKRNLIRDRVRVVLVAPRNPLNIGAAARALSNFGFGQLRLVNAYELAFREARSAVGASDVMKQAEEFATVAEAVADCELVIGTTAARKRQLHHPLRPLAEGGKRLRRGNSRRVALLFGSEKRGLSNEDLSYCHWLIRIPTREEHPSMNLGQAVAVCLYELARENAVRPAAEKTPPAKGAELDRATEMLRDALRLSGYCKRGSEIEDEKLRRLIRRSLTTAEDAQVWQGMLRQILWKMRQ